MSHVEQNPKAAVWNVPNILSAARIAMALACFAALELGFFAAALGLFVLAAATDWLDGYWARRFNQITQLGRILDPFADKLLICGAFVYLAKFEELGMPAWVAVVVLSRELLVTALRSFIESTGGDFSAQWAGKWKMVLQCAVVLIGLYRLILWAPRPEWLGPLFLVAMWLTVALTLYSGATYAASAIAMASRSGKQN